MPEIFSTLRTNQPRQREVHFRPPVCAFPTISFLSHKQTKAKNRKKAPTVLTSERQNELVGYLRKEEITQGCDRGRLAANSLVSLYRFRLREPENPISKYVYKNKS